MNSELNARLLKALVGKPLVNNVFRGTLVEAMLAGVLEPDWRWQADGWGSYDFEGQQGIGLEVKQSAARQDWHDAESKPNRGRFDIAERTGRWKGATWFKEPGRAAAIYIFAWHPIVDPTLADHRDEKQWLFHVLPAWRLPAQRSIALSGIQSLVKHCGIYDVKSAVTAVLEGMSESKT